MSNPNQSSFELHVFATNVNLIITYKYYIYGKKYFKKKIFCDGSAGDREKITFDEYCNAKSMWAFLEYENLNTNRKEITA